MTEGTESARGPGEMMGNAGPCMLAGLRANASPEQFHPMLLEMLHRTRP
jgi:hypothetical protein